MKKTYLEEVTAIAKAFCKKYGYNFMFANDYKFGYEDKNGQFWTIRYEDLVEAIAFLEKTGEK